MTRSTFPSRRLSLLRDPASSPLGSATGACNDPGIAWVRCSSHRAGASRATRALGGPCFSQARRAGAGVCGRRATGDPPDLQSDVVTLRYLDVCLVLATAPFVLVGNLPIVGYLIGAGAWLLTRAGTGFIHARARRVGEAKLRAGLQVAGMMLSLIHISEPTRRTPI